MCALHARASSPGTLRSVRLNGRQPRSEHDTALLCAARARASVIVNSLHTVESEGGHAPDFSLAGQPAAAELAAWRRGLGLGESGAHVLLTRGGRELDAALPVFSADARFKAVVGVPFCAAGAPAVRWRRAPGAPAPSAVPLTSEPAPLEAALGEILAALRAGDRPWCAPPPPAAAAAPLVLVEAGAELTSPLYSRAGGSGAPDWLLLSEFAGEAIDPSCVGEPVVERSTLEALFVRRAEAERGGWRFSLLQRRKEREA